MSSIPEVRELMAKDTKELKKVLLLGSLIPIIVYAVFAIIFLSVFGSSISEIATISLSSIGSVPFILGSAFALVAMTTAYLALGLALQEMYNYDYKIKKGIAFILTCAIPLLLILLGVKSFIKTIGVSGAFSGGLTAILVTFIFYKAKKHGERKPEYELSGNKLLSILAIIVFVFGMIIELLNVLR